MRQIDQYLVSAVELWPCLYDTTFFRKPKKSTSQIFPFKVLEPSKEFCRDRKIKGAQKLNGVKPGWDPALSKYVNSFVSNMMKASCARKIRGFSYHSTGNTEDFYD